MDFLEIKDKKRKLNMKLLVKNKLVKIFFWILLIAGCTNCGSSNLDSFLPNLEIDNDLISKWKLSYNSDDGGCIGTFGYENFLNEYDIFDNYDYVNITNDSCNMTYSDNRYELENGNEYSFEDYCKAAGQRVVLEQKYHEVTPKGCEANVINQVKLELNSNNELVGTFYFEIIFSGNCTSDFQSCYFSGNVIGI